MKTRCECCKKVIKDNEPRIGIKGTKFTLCMKCEGSTIEGYKLECGGNWYFDPDPDMIYQKIDDMDVGDEYKISKETMLYGKFLTLPEFDGF